MVSVLQTIDTNHEDLIHDAQLDFYGTMLATGSSDCSVKIFSVKDKKQTLLADLKEHQGPVWGVAWSHPLFGSLLASCSYDKMVIIWQNSNGKWSKLYVHQSHESSVNSICWAPHEIGLALACASSDGNISIIQSAQNGNWNVSIITDAHILGVNAVSWAPVVDIHSLLSPNNPNVGNLPKRIVSGGCDSLVKIWNEDQTGGSSQWVEEAKLEGHQDWVRDVAWAPGFTTQREKIVSCGQDGKVILWQRFPGVHGTSNPNTTTQWAQTVIHTYPDIVWHVSWNLTGNMLAVAGADNTVTLWKENLEGRWVALSQVQRGPTAPKNSMNAVAAQKSLPVTNDQKPQTSFRSFNPQQNQGLMMQNAAMHTPVNQSYSLTSPMNLAVGGYQYPLSGQINQMPNNQNVQNFVS